MSKKKIELRIAFLGNPEFARYQLEQIIACGYNVVVVVSAPDRPAGRGMKLVATPVTTYAREQNIACLQPTNLKNEEFLLELESYKADLQLVIAFRMLPEAVWNMPPMGTYNLHASLLPQYRGAAPINWAIINGETETGVTTFKLKHEIDTGDLLVQKKCNINPEDNAGNLHNKLMYLGAEAVHQTLQMLTKGDTATIPQIGGENLKSAPKLFTENTGINWADTHKNIVNLIRGLSPSPTAHTMFHGKKMQIYHAVSEEIQHQHKAGTYISDGKKYLKVAVSDGFVTLLNVKIQGKRQMNIQDFLNGYDITHLGLPFE